MLLRLLPLLLPGLLAGCLSATPPGTAFSSEPPGARVLVDGQDSGWVTPCMISLDLEDVHAVRFELEGFTPYEVRLEPSYRRHVVDWHLGASGAQSTIHFPLFLPPEELLVPFRVDHGLQPGRIFARLRPKDDA